jgi:hypothetical protein
MSGNVSQFGDVGQNVNKVLFLGIREQLTDLSCHLVERPERFVLPF